LKARWRPSLLKVRWRRPFSRPHHCESPPCTPDRRHGEEILTVL
jgi:hypothetical protein